MTGVKTRVENAESGIREWITGAHYYDRQYRVVQTVTDNAIKGGTDVVTTAWSFTGRIEKQKTVHSAFGNTVANLEQFVYCKIR